MAQAQLPSYRTYAQLGDYFGVSRTTVGHFLALLMRLPSTFVEWLRRCNDRGILSYLTERRRRPVTRIDNKEQQAACLRQLVSEAEARAFS